MIRNIFILSVGLLWTSVASAHGTVAPGESFMHNLAHPFLGLDHLLVMFAVGLWASRQRSLLSASLLPLVFVVAIPAGQLLAPAAPPQAMLELITTASVLLFGVILFLELPVRLPVVLPLVAATGALHGLAHVVETGNSGTIAVIAMMFGSMLLHGLGVTTGFATSRPGLSDFYRLAGAGLIVAGAGLATTAT